MTTADPRIDLDAYFQRIGYAGPRDATLETLRALHLLHPQTIAFENLDPLLGRPVDLDPAAVARKLVHSRRGGYCFEQNLLFQLVLEMLGFHVSGLAARVLWTQPEDAITARSHMLLKIELEGHSYIADIGFGGLTLTAPLRLVANDIQQTPHGPFRLHPVEGGFKLQAQLDENWTTLYRFDLLPAYEIDYTVSNYYLSTHPDSYFRNALIVARPTPTGRQALLNNRYSVYGLDGTVERRELTMAAEFHHLLDTQFGLTVPDLPAFDAALTRLGLI